MVSLNKNNVIIHDLKYNNVNNIGSIETQVIFMTNKIKNLTYHLQNYKKDYHSRYGLQKLISKRRKLLKYIKVFNNTRYTILIKKLKLRDSY